MEEEMKQKLTTEEMNWIKDNLSNYTPQEFSEIFNISKKTIAGIISNIKSKKLWTCKEEQFLIENKDTMTSKEIGKHIHKSQGCVYSKLNQLNLKKKSFSSNSFFKKGEHPSSLTEFKHGHKPKISKERNTKISIAVSGEKHPNFHGWKSREPYGVAFSPKLKDQIRKKYHYRCQQCFRHQEELTRKLHIHHIDFDKQNNHISNLIPLCNSCHMQTQFNRQDWINYFKEKVANE